MRGDGNTSWSGWTHEIAAVTDTHVVHISDRYGWIRAWAHGDSEPCAELLGVTWGVNSMGVGGGRVAWSTPSPESLCLLEVDGGLHKRGFGSTAGPDQVSLSPDGLTVLSVEGEFGSKRRGMLRRFDDGEDLEAVTLRARAELGSFSPTGALYAIGMGSFDSSGEVLIRAPGSARAKKRAKDPGGGPLALGWRPDGEALAVAWREAVERVPMAKGGAAGRWEARRPAAVALLPDDRVVIGEEWDKRLRVLPSGATLDLHCPCSALLPHPEGAQIFAGLEDGQILVLTPDLALLEVLRAHMDKVTALGWSEGALWSASEDGTIRRWPR